MKLITRDFYLKKLTDVMGTPDIKVITGVRRCGKSKLLDAFRAQVEATVPDCNVIAVNFNLPEYDPLLECRALYDYVMDAWREGKRNFVFIDEVQMCHGFERAVNGLHASERFDLYVTGSNAFLLSSDLATLFTGRTFAISVYPFSFCEYMTYFGDTDRYAAFDRYLLEGGMAGSYPYRDREAKYAYLAEVFNTLIVRDIRAKYNLRNMQSMERIVDFLMDNISNLTSARNVAAALTDDEPKTNHVTVGTYIQYLCSAFAFYRIGRYDIRGRKCLSRNDKYYLSDHAFRYARLGTRNMDYGRTLENIVALELLRRGYEVYVGVLYRKEIDFVAIRRDEQLYIQVSDTVDDPKTLARELSPLLQIRDAYPKLLIARTRHAATTRDGIRIIDIADWLTAP